MGKGKIEHFTGRKIPSAQKIVPFALPKPYKNILSNGMELYLFKNQFLDLIFFTLTVKAGYLFENLRLLASACYSLLSESSRKFTLSEVDDFLDFYGTEFSVSVHIEFVEINFVIPKSNCEKVLPYIFDFINNPLFRSDRLSHYKERKINNLKRNRRNVDICATEQLYKTLFNPKLPIGEILTKEHIEKLTEENMQEYHRQTFCAENCKLFVSGNVDDKLQQLIVTTFSDIPLGKTAIYPDFFPDNDPVEHLIVEPKEGVMQSAIRLCRRFNSFHHPDRRDFWVVTELLGGYPGSRLMENLRERNGFTYSIFNATIYFANSSFLCISSKVNVDNTKRALEECKIEMEKLAREVVSQDELETVKNYMLGYLLRSFDGTVSYMNNYSEWNAFGYDELELAELINAINGITPERVRELAVKYLNPESFSTIVVGQFK